MGSRTGMLVKTTDDVWPILGKHSVEATSSRVVPWIYVECASSPSGVEALAEMLSRALGSECIAFAESAPDAHAVFHFDRGERVHADETSSPRTHDDVTRLCKQRDCDPRKIDGLWKPQKRSFFAGLFGKAAS